MTDLGEQTLTVSERPRIVLPQPPPETPRRAPGQVVRAVDSGETARDIVQAWEEWVEGMAHISMTKALRGMTLRTVKDLLSKKLTSVEVKWALAFWVAEWVSNVEKIPSLSPKRLEEIALTARIASDPKATAWIQSMRNQVQTISGGRGRTRAALASLYKETP